MQIDWGRDFAHMPVTKALGAELKHAISWAENESEICPLFKFCLTCHLFTCIYA